VDLGIVIAVVVVALFFDYTNGFHDAANAIATSVSTRALTPRVALVMAAVMNFVGAFLGQKVAHTIAEVIAPPSGREGLIVVLAGLLGAIAWNLITWYYGLPSSSSQALIGGLVGAGLVAGTTVHWATIWDKVVIPMVASPVIGFVLAFAVMLAILWIFRNRNAGRVQRGFRLGQTVSASAMALGHGLQDAQKTMGVIFLALVTGGYLAPDTEQLPLWVIASSATAISLGTYSGGWRIMRTLGRKIVHLDPPHAFAAESVGASVLYASAFIWAAPVSTTQVITGAIMGSGATRRMSAVRWGMARSIGIAWVLTFPAAGLGAALCFGVLNPLLS
jgi:inorganic phosphate transporter, PiT family